MNEFIQICTTVASQADATKIATVLVERKLAACVQVSGPIASLYWWEGRVADASEWQCVAKTTGDAFQHVEAAIREVHSYEVPEIIAVPIVAGGKDYLDWIRAQVTAAAQQ